MLRAHEGMVGLLGTCAGRSLVIAGNGRTIWDDLRRSGAFPYGLMDIEPSYVPQDVLPPDLMAINDIGMYLPSLEHWVSFHDDTLVLQNELRYRVWPYTTQPQLHSNTRGQMGREDRRSPIHEAGVSVQYWGFEEPRMYSSGVLGICIGLMLGYDRIVLAGMPADNQGNIFQPPWEWSKQGTDTAQEVWQNLIAWVPEVKERVRSLSGNTRKWLGAPDE